MTARWLAAGLLTALGIGVVTAATPDEQARLERGRNAFLTRSFNPPVWSLASYRNAWKLWDGAGTTPPADYDAAFRERYGLHPAPYPNNGLPMGLREGNTLIGKGVSVDCLVCHGGSIAGQSYVGLGNASLDVHALFSELNMASGRHGKLPFTFSNVRGTSEAGGMGVFLLGYRNPDLSLRTTRKELGLHDDLCEDVPAWWLLKKKRTMYHTGGSDARSVRALMQFMMSPLNSAATFEREEATFRDIQAYMLSLEPPKYPLPIDRALAAKGETLFRRDCARCHGSYGANATYPNRIVPIDEIGTDPKRFRGIEEAYGRYYNESWFGKEKPGWLVEEGAAMEVVGYQAPPLDGVWATAPYLHNGSVPTLEHLLKSTTRPKIFTRSYRTGLEDYDAVRVGWKVTVLSQGADPSKPAVERRKVYDTTQPGRGNGGHTYGDKLGDAERAAVIEYLKTL
jgi:hypothetical protein